MPKRKASSGASGKPRRPLNSYALFCQSYKGQQENGAEDGTTDKKMSFSEFVKQCAASWNTLSAEEKNVYKQQASDDKKRYNEEMKVYNTSGQAVGNNDTTSKKKRKKTDPKKPRTSFIYFCQEYRDKVKVDNPSWSMLEVSKELGKMWQNLDSKEREKYKKLFEDDKTRYKAEMKKKTLKDSSLSPPESEDGTEEENEVVEEEDEGEDEEEDEEEERDEVVNEDEDVDVDEGNGETPAKKSSPSSENGSNDSVGNDDDDQSETNNSLSIADVDEEDGEVESIIPNCLAANIEQGRKLATFLTRGKRRKTFAFW